MEKEKSAIKRVLFGTIRKKILIGYFAVLIVIAVAGLLSLNQVITISNTLEQGIPDRIAELEKSSELDALARFIQYYDEVLTMSARNYAFTSDVKWKDRYNDIVPMLDSVIKDAIEKGDKQDKEFFSSVDSANLALVEMEEESMNLVDSGNPEKAVEILESDEYWEQKEIYKQGLVSYVERRGQNYEEALTASTQGLHEIAEDSKETVGEITYFIIAAIILALSISGIVGFLVSKKISQPIKKLTKAAEQLQKKNFDVRVDINTGDEIETLAKTFNDAGKALKDVENEYKKIDKAKTEFLSITSHELRSPMTPMRAQLQMLEANYFGKLNKKQRESIDIVLRNTERLDKIIQDFLEISRIEAARLKFNFVKTTLADYISIVCEEMKGFMPEKKIEIIPHIEKLPIIEVDPDRTMQVLRNLLNNAIKFSPDKGKIWVNVGVRERMILISVRDQGVGISPENQKRIFEPFFQEDNMYQHKSGGTGLGLAICRGIVESQNGSLWLESTKGKGSVFYFTVQLKPVKDIKPIKLLFSPTSEINNKLKEVFKGVLGPLGEKEFTRLENQNKLGKENIINYVEYLLDKGILDNETAEEFKYEINSVFGKGSRKIEDKDIVGFIRKKEKLRKLTEKDFFKGGKK